MTEVERRKNIKNLIKEWNNKGNENEDTNNFWRDILEKIFGVKNASREIKIQKKVEAEETTRNVDVYITSTKVLIEQKSIGVDLDKKHKQSDGTMLTPYEQAKRYSDDLPLYEKPRWIIVSDFQSFRVYDMNKSRPQPQIILLKDLETEWYRLKFIVDDSRDLLEKEKEISIQAGDIIGKIYDKLLKKYIDPNSDETFKNLNKLCVRLVFCLYAEDSERLGEILSFHDYLQGFDARSVRNALIEYFKVLNTKKENRDPYLDDALRNLPYVNGGLFADDDSVIPTIDDEIYNLLVNEASANFNWSNISPTIFGALFESTLNPETREGLGMHYTSIEDIHKIIDPLFLNELKRELEIIKNSYEGKRKIDQLEYFRDKLSKIKFLDPACGSGNFLTETYISLRRLENEALKEIYKSGQIVFDFRASIKVKIDQFYGIEINNFAVSVAKTALWIAESQMMRETEDIVQSNLEFFPLKTNATIIEGNALRLDWESIIGNDELTYIMGNPPFFGKQKMTNEQKEDLKFVFGNNWDGLGNLDYVAGWYKKCVDYIKNTDIHCALVSTNSITQGQIVPILWKPLFEEGIHFDFAYRTFVWNSHAKEKAHVHCVIIGFSCSTNNNQKIIYEEKDDKIPFVAVDNINAYLMNADNIFVESRKTPLGNAPQITTGNMPNDGGYLSKYTEEQYESIVSRYPEAKPMFRRIVGGDEYLNNEIRYCLWLKDTPRDVIQRVSPVYEAIKKVREKRLKSTRPATRKLAESSFLFGEIRQPETDYLVIPSQSGTRSYIPIGYMESNIIVTNAVQIIPSASLYNFGILVSNVHMIWVRAIGGKMKSDPRYSIQILYNNFPWPNITDIQRARIEVTAKKILDERANAQGRSLAELYKDDMLLYPELAKAHKDNDKAVMDAYGFDYNMPEDEIALRLLKMYQKLIEGN